jgi:hypothetical protein
MNAYRGVMRLAAEKPEWLPVVGAALQRARANERFGGEFAGSWVLKDLQASGTLSWLPNLRFLVAYGIAEKSGESTRGGQRAYYRLPDPDGIERALEELGAFG